MRSVCGRSTRRSPSHGSTRSAISEGDEVELWLDTSRVHYFDAETGENLFLQEETEAVQDDESERDEAQEHPVPA